MGRSATLLSFLILAVVGGGAAVALVTEHPRAVAVVVALGLSSAFLIRQTFRRLPPASRDRVLLERGRLEERLETMRAGQVKMRTRAETASRFRDEFVAAVRHELKTPLNAILGFSDVLLERVDGPLNPQQRESTEAIRAGGEYLQDLIESVLSEWVPRDAPMPLTEIDVGALMLEVARLVRGQVQKGDPLAIDVRLRHENLRVIGDPRRMRQILINLATNAIRATHQGSVTLEADRAGVEIRLTVRDTGPGIAPDELPHLFTEYVQGGAEDHRAGGSGLGLALTREMVQWHDGRLEVETVLGQGTAFHVFLPTESAE